MHEERPDIARRRAIARRTGRRGRWDNRRVRRPSDDDVARAASARRRDRALSSTVTGQLRDEVAAARRIVVKVGSSSLPPRSAASTRPASTPWSTRSPRGSARGHARSCWSPPAPSPPGLAPLGLRTRAHGPRHASRPPPAVGQGLLVTATRSRSRRYGRTVGQVLLTVDDITRRSHYRNAQRTMDAAARAGRPADRQRERHRRHRRDPLRRQRPARRPGRPPGPRRPAGAALRRRRRSTTATRARPRHVADRRRARPAGPRRDLHRGSGQGRGRDRRHGHEGRGGPDRDRGRDPGGADLGGARGAGPARRGGRHAVPPDRLRGRRPGCCGWPTPPTRAGRCTSTPAPCALSWNGGSRCCRPG